jgi:hypothetical protein
MAPVHCGVLSQYNNVRRGRGRPMLTWRAIKRYLKGWDIRYLEIYVWTGVLGIWKATIDSD